MYQQAEERDEYVHRQPGGRRSDARRRRPAVQRDLGGLQGKIFLQFRSRFNWNDEIDINVRREHISFYK